MAAAIAAVMIPGHARADEFTDKFNYTSWGRTPCDQVVRQMQSTELQMQSNPQSTQSVYTLWQGYIMGFWGSSNSQYANNPAVGFTGHTLNPGQLITLVEEACQRHPGEVIDGAIIDAWIKAGLNHW